MAAETHSELDPGTETRLFIDGEFVDSVEGGRIPIINPHNNTVLGHVVEARQADVDRAVESARKAFSIWKRISAAERGRLLFKLADAIERDLEGIARLETLDTGHPIRDTRNLDVPRTVATFRYFAGLADKIDGRVPQADPGFLNYITREPIGVIGQIVPWNFPLMLTSWKLGPALAAGNTVVMKPAELTPLTTLRLARLIAEAGIPPGVVNIVPGYGNIAGQYLAEHSGVDKVSFTGSTLTGRRIVQASAGNLKRLHLELGGKGANIVFDDADLDVAVAGSAVAIFHNQGQTCIAGSRLLLHEAIADTFLDKFLALAESIRIGNPLDEMTEMGPLTSLAHRDRVLSYVDLTKDQGGAILIGGKVPADPALKTGCYIEPTVVTAKPGDRVCQEEVFGPLVSICLFKDEAEAIAIANSSRYGLGGGLWTRNLQRAHRVAKALRCGVVWVNTYKRISPTSPFGGVGESGYGRDLGLECVQEYTFAKSFVLNIDAPIVAHYSR